MEKLRKHNAQLFYVLEFHHNTTLLNSSMKIRFPGDDEIEVQVQEEKDRMWNVRYTG